MLTFSAYGAYLFIQSDFASSNTTWTELGGYNDRYIILIVIIFS